MSFSNAGRVGRGRVDSFQSFAEVEGASRQSIHTNDEEKALLKHEASQVTWSMRNNLVAAMTGYS